MGPRAAWKSLVLTCAWAFETFALFALASLANGNLVAFAFCLLLGLVGIVQTGANATRYYLTKKWGRDVWDD